MKNEKRCQLSDIKGILTGYAMDGLLAVAITVVTVAVIAAGLPVVAAVVVAVAAAAVVVV